MSGLRIALALLLAAVLAAGASGGCCAILAGAPPAWAGCPLTAAAERLRDSREPAPAAPVRQPEASRAPPVTF